MGLPFTFAIAAAGTTTIPRGLAWPDNTFHPKLCNRITGSPSFSRLPLRRSCSSPPPPTRRTSQPTRRFAVLALLVPLACYLWALRDAPFARKATGATPGGRVWAGKWAVAGLATRPTDPQFSGT